MLMTFPTKESLLRNLNERDVSEVFLIIANFKALARWNLIPLKSLTILLGPNSSGKSIVHQAIEIVKDFKVDYDYDFSERSREKCREIANSRNGGEICIGISMPFIGQEDVDWCFKEDVHHSLLDIYYRYLNECGGTNLEGNGTLSTLDWFFILDGMGVDKYLFKSLSKVRYTLLSIPSKQVYQVFFDNALASTLLSLDPIGASLRSALNDEQSGDIWPDSMAEIRIDEANFFDAVRSSNTARVTIHPIANRLLLYASLQFRQDMADSLNAEENAFLRNFSSYLEDAEKSSDFIGEISFVIPREGLFFKSHVPSCIMDGNAVHNYIRDVAAFSMVVALYWIPYNLCFDRLAGDVTDDVREIGSDWKVIGCASDTTSHSARSLTALIENEVQHRNTRFSWDKNKRNDRLRYLKEINRWLTEEAFLNSQYELRVHSSIELSFDAFDDDFIIKDSLWSEIQEASVWLEANDYIVSYKGRLYLADRDNRYLDFKQVGEGYTQVLPLLIGLISRETLFFKQPEVHLHPRLQSRVADCFVETVFNEKQANKSRVRIIETHSEHFVLRLLRRLRESSFDELYHSSLTVYPEDVAFVYLQPQGDSTLVHEIAVLPSGEFIEGWPDGFFDERDEDLWGMPSPRGR
jgi:hypothetical protein